jgi:hypothetical protein
MLFEGAMEKFSRFHETVKLCLLSRKSIRRVEFQGLAMISFLIQFASEIGSEIEGNSIKVPQLLLIEGLGTDGMLEKLRQMLNVLGTVSNHFKHLSSKSQRRLSIPSPLITYLGLCVTGFYSIPISSG